MGEGEAGVPLQWPEFGIAGARCRAYQIASSSVSGQVGSEDLAVRATFVRDFREQVVYYEALFQIVANETWVNGLWVASMNWFDQFRRAEEFSYFDETLLGSPRSKPAEQVMSLWFASDGE